MGGDKARALALKVFDRTVYAVCGALKVGYYPHMSFVGTHIAEEDASCLCTVVYGPPSRALGKGCRFVK